MLRQRMQAAGYTLVGDPDALFEDRSAEKAEFLIAGRIRDVGRTYAIHGPLRTIG